MFESCVGYTFWYFAKRHILMRGLWMIEFIIHDLAFGCSSSIP